MGRSNQLGMVSGGGHTATTQSTHHRYCAAHTGPVLQLETEARKDFTITFKTLCLIGDNSAAPYAQHGQLCVKSGDASAKKLAKIGRKEV